MRGRTKLNWNSAEEIRDSDESLRVLADRYGVHFTTIRAIKKGWAWKVEDDPRPP